MKRALSSLFATQSSILLSGGCERLSRPILQISSADTVLSLITPHLRFECRLVGMGH